MLCKGGEAGSRETKRLHDCVDKMVCACEVDLHKVVIADSGAWDKY